MLQLQKKLGAQEIALSESQMELLWLYVGMLFEWNERVNLISKNDRDVIVSRHIQESLAILPILSIPKESKVMDIGSGAGFPGLPIKIARPDLRITLIESKRMRALFLREVIEELGLENIAVCDQRIEELHIDTTNLGTFDMGFARAVAKLKTLWDWSEPLLKKSGKLVALKGGDFNAELNELYDSVPNVIVKLRPLPESLVNTSLKRVAVSMKHRQE